MPEELIEPPTEVEIAELICNVSPVAVPYLRRLVFQRDGLKMEVRRLRDALLVIGRDEIPRTELCVTGQHEIDICKFAWKTLQERKPSVE